MNKKEVIKALKVGFGEFSARETTLINETYALAKKEVVPGEDKSFDIFWEQFHEVTGKPKVDKERARKAWKKMNMTKRRLAYEKIIPYSKTNKDKDYLRKACYYLSDKLYEDELIDVTNIISDGIRTSKADQRFNDFRDVYQ